MHILRLFHFLTKVRLFGVYRTTQSAAVFFIEIKVGTEKSHVNQIRTGVRILKGGGLTDPLFG